MGKFQLTITAIDFKDECKTPHRFELSIRNGSAEAASGIICFQPPANVQPVQYFEVHIDGLEAGEAKTIPLQYEFPFGGRYVFYFWEKQAQLETLAKAAFFLSGPGIYSGDTHNHSDYSDGKSTLQENRESMIAKGHSFLYSTDHNTLAHEEEILAYGKTEQAETFLHAAGWEYTTKFGHALAYGTKQVYDPHLINEHDNPALWQDFIDDTNAKGGFVHLAHPFEAARYEFGSRVLEDVRGFAGIEVWNGFNHHALSYENRKAFELWDELNKRGEAHYMGSAVSDAHTKEKQGNPFIKGFMEELNEEQVMKMLGSGRFYGSNGPEIGFSIGDAEMGGTLLLGDEKQLAKVHLSVFDPAGAIEHIVLYRSIINEKAPRNAKRNKTVKALEINMTGEDDRRHCEKECYLEMQAGEFYRVEVITAFGIVAYDAQKVEQDKGFAFTNPIWIERG